MLITIRCFDAVRIGAFSRSYALAEISCCYGAGKNPFFIENSGRTVTAVSPGGKYLYSIYGGNRRNGFFQARELVCDSTGNIYILDKLINKNGKDIESERIFRYRSDGNLDVCLFEESKLPGQNLMGMTFVDDSLYFGKVSGSDISIMQIGPDGKAAVCRSFEWEDAKKNIHDIAISNTLEAAAITKKGTVVRLSDGAVLFDAEKLGSSEYSAMALDAEYDDDGILYINDVGNRVIMKYDGSELTEFIGRGEPLRSQPDDFSKLPIFSGLNCSGGTVSVIYSDNFYDRELGEVIYTYNAYVVSAKDKSIVFNSNKIPKSTLVFAKGIICCVTIALLALSAIYTVLIAFLLFRRRQNTQRTFFIQLLLLVIAVTTAGIVASITIRMTNQRYYDEVMNKMTNIALLMASTINEADIGALNTPDSYTDDAYGKIDSRIRLVLKSDLNAENGIYCVIYKVHNNIVYEAYSDERLHGTGYPMAGSFEGSAEQEIYQTGEYKTFGSYSGADGSYMFVLMPIKNADGDVIALMEIGTDLYIFASEANSLFFNVLLYSAMAIIILLLFAGEFMICRKLSGENRFVRCADGTSSPGILRKNAGLVRPISFLLFFAANMSTAFLPIYGEKLWQEGSLIPREMASALPLSAELLFAALTAFAGGFAVNRIGARNLCVFGAIMYVAGNAVCGMSPNLAMLILGNSVCGVGGGCFATSINSYVAGYSQESQRNAGFSGFNAAYLAGMNCGTVTGSLISEKIGIPQAFFGASIVSLISVAFIIRFMDIRSPEITDTVEKSEKQTSGEILRFIFKPKILRYFLLLFVPYLMCTSFLNYFFPLFGEENSLTSTQISSAFLVSGIISIYLGPLLTDLIVEKFGAKLSAVIASGIYIFSFLLFTLHQNIAVCFVIVGLLAVADSFGLTSHSLEYSSLSDVVKLGEGRAMGISSAFENTAYTISPVFFSGMFMLLGYAGGIGLAGFAMLILLLLYIPAEFGIFRKKRMMRQ